MTSPIARLAHFSDLHVTVPRYGWRREDWFNKRLAAWINLRVFGRGWRFRHAEEVLRSLAADLRQRRPGHLVFSGDATAMGFREEAARAAEILDVEAWPGLAVPGNHDYCTTTAQRDGHFEMSFGSWQSGRRIGEDRYPFAQQVGGVWLVGVNSATANRWPWDATGRVGREQLERLERLLAGLGEGPRVLVTHYPVARASGWPEPPVRHLRDLRALIAVAARGRVGLWLHGHRHHAYHLKAGALAPFPVICAGSATQTGLWSYGEYVVEARKVSARLRVYDPAAKAFQEGAAFDLDMPG